MVPKLGQMHLETGGCRCRTSWLCSEMPEASRDSNGMSGPVTQGAHSTLQTHMGYSWPSSPLSLMQGRQGGYCSVPDNIRGPGGNRQAYDLEPEKACNSQALGIIHRDGVKMLWGLSRSGYALTALVSKAQSPVLNRSI